MSVFVWGKLKHSEKGVILSVSIGLTVSARVSQDLVNDAGVHFLFKQKH